MGGPVSAVGFHDGDHSQPDPPPPPRPKRRPEPFHPLRTANCYSWLHHVSALLACALATNLASRAQVPESGGPLHGVQRIYSEGASGSI